MSLDGITCNITATGTNTIQGCNCIDGVTKIADLTTDDITKIAGLTTYDYATVAATISAWYDMVSDKVTNATTTTTKWNYNNTVTTNTISDTIDQNYYSYTIKAPTVSGTISPATLVVDNNTTPNKNKNNNESEKKEMKFNFGPCSNDNVRMSMYGLAVKNKAGTWVSYNDGKIIDVEPFNFDGRKYLYKIPVAFKDIAAGDILIHNGVPVFVSSVEKGIHVIDVYDGCEKDIILTSNMFGFEYATKVVSLFSMTKQAPTAEQPFGNFLPFLMAKEGENIDPMMFMLMSGGKFDMSNPMMMYFLMNRGDIDPMMLMFMMNNNK